MANRHKKDAKNLVKRLMKAGWRVEKTNNGHFQAFHPSGTGIVTVSGSPSCDYWLKNALGDIKRLDKDFK